jgi:hypothetical protein
MSRCLGVIGFDLKLWVKDLGVKVISKESPRVMGCFMLVWSAMSVVSWICSSDAPPGLSQAEEQPQQAMSQSTRGESIAPEEQGDCATGAMHPTRS